MIPAPRFLPIEPHHVDAAAELLAEAMDVDAAYRYLFPDSRERRAGLMRLFAGNLRAHLRYRCSYVALDREERPIGTMTLRPPGGVRLSALTLLRHGLAGFVRAHGLEAVRRLLWLKSTYDALEAELAGHQAHWYVHMMAVAPALQGCGVGSQLLNHVLSLRLATRPDLHTVLTTHSPRNLVFYRHAGFETAWERRLQPKHGASYVVWGMARAPQPVGTEQRVLRSASERS